MFFPVYVRHATALSFVVNRLQCRELKLTTFENDNTVITCIYYHYMV
jgi:hypothetical protein